MKNRGEVHSLKIFSDPFSASPQAKVVVSIYCSHIILVWGHIQQICKSPAIQHDYLWQDQYGINLYILDI